MPGRFTVEKRSQIDMLNSHLAPNHPRLTWTRLLGEAATASPATRRLALSVQLLRTWATARAPCSLEAESGLPQPWHGRRHGRAGADWHGTMPQPGPGPRQKRSRSAKLRDGAIRGGGIHALPSQREHLAMMKRAPVQAVKHTGSTLLYS